MRIRVINFMRKSTAHRFAVGFLFLFSIGLLVGNVFVPLTQQLYYRVVDGNYLLNVKSVTAEKKTTQDNDLVFAFCRYPRVRIIAVNNVRVFYKNENGQKIPVDQRWLPDNIAYERISENECLPISISPDHRPNDVGKYKFCQEFDFKVYGVTKTADFCSTEYEIVASDTIRQ